MRTHSTSKTNIIGKFDNFTSETGKYRKLRYITSSSHMKQGQNYNLEQKIEENVLKHSQK